MANITAKDVAELRSKTGCGMMDCKKALVEADGNFDEAVKLLREKGLAKADAKQGRIAAEGVVDIMLSDDKQTAAMVEVNSETDFVAKNETFREFVRAILRTILKNRPADVDALLACKLDGSEETVEAELKGKIFTIGEKLSIRRFVVVDGTLATYIHGAGVSGVIVKFDADDAAKNASNFAEVTKNVALQVASMECRFVNRDAVPAEVVKSETEINLAKIANDPKNANKPDAIKEKMALGMLNKFYETVCLAEQAYVKEDSISVEKYLDREAKAVGGSIKLVDFFRFEKGEGLEKREDNFAEEIANMVKK